MLCAENLLFDGIDSLEILLGYTVAYLFCFLAMLVDLKISMWSLRTARRNGDLQIIFLEFS